MRGFGFAAIAAVAIWNAPASAAGIGPDAAIRNYCEPLVAGASAGQVKDSARKDGFRDEVVAGQPMLRSGEVLIGISDSPRVCFLQAPPALSLEQGFALADSWAGRHPGAVRGAATKGPDGAPVRAWSAPARKMALIATQQTAASGQKVMNFILMPLPAGSAARR
jgi:hypothetical protein